MPRFAIRFPAIVAPLAGLLLGACSTDADRICADACDSLRACSISCQEIEGCEEGLSGSVEDDVVWEEVTDCITSTDCSDMFRSCLSCDSSAQCAPDEICEGRGPDARCVRGVTPP